MSSSLSIVPFRAQPKNPQRISRRRRAARQRVARTAVVRVRRIMPRNPGMGIAEGAAASYATRVQSVEPIISRSAKSYRVKHRELVLSAVAGSVAFTVQNVLSLNPGVAATFPWLAPQANQWEQYRVHRLCAEWVPIAPTSTQGDMILSPDYDASDPTPTTEVQASDNFGSVANSCWRNTTCELDPSAMMGLGPRKYVRSTAIAGDIKTFDVGKLFVCSVNETGTTAVGKLYLDYDIEFFVPQNSPSTSTTSQQTSLYTISGGAQALATTVAEPVAFDTALYDPLGLGTPVSGVFTPPAGTYRLEAQVSVQDSANELMSSQLFVYKNGAAVTGLKSSSYAGSGQLVLSSTIFGIVTCNGTDTFNIQVIVTGAAGTLTVVNAQSQLLVSLA
jgi:hypothetical protein